MRWQVPEQLVEGHTVWAVLELAPNATRDEDYAAAVAILVKERFYTRKDTRFPGVLWFNDQYLVAPEQTERERPRDRYPCTGAIIAVNRGHPVDQDEEGRWTLINASYANESYLITDPNEHMWMIDLWNTTYGTPAWTVAILGNDAGASRPDDGTCRGSAYNDVPCVEVDPAQYGVNRTRSCRDVIPRTVSSVDPRHRRTGDHGMGYPCHGCDPLRYNAVLYFRLAHLESPNGTKDHRERVGDAWWNDSAGCHADDTDGYTCPGDDDDREGNSHPYNPQLPFPAASYDGRNNHGGSATCGPGGNITLDCHGRFDIDVYYGYVTPPVVREFWLVDLPGAEAPYHCHEDITICGWEDVGS